MNKLILGIFATMLLTTIAPGAFASPKALNRAPADTCGNYGTDDLGEPVITPEHDRYWQAANTPRRCGPYQPWRIGTQCPNGQNTRGSLCNGLPHGKLCYVQSSDFYQFQCDAPPGQSPSQNNAWFDIYVCP